MAEDSVDLETITGLEARITAALERISAAAAASAIGGRESAAEAQAAFGAERAEAAETARRAEALEAELAEAMAARELLETRLAEAEAARESLAAELAEAVAARDAAEAAPAPDPAPEPAPEPTPEQAPATLSEEDEGKVALLKQRVQRLREERNAIREERDELAEELDSYRLGGGAVAAASAEPTESAEDLLTALRELRAANADLSATSAGMRQAAVQGDGAPDPELLNAAMAAELLSLQAERAADAAEMDRILADLRPLVTGDTDA